MATHTSRRDLMFLFVTFLLLLLGWGLALFQAPPDAQMGNVYRIIFVHVPAAAVALGLASCGLLITSIATLVKTDERLLTNARAWAEVDLFFTVLTLLTGAIWGRPTWGSYWTWDPRITTTFLLAILLIAYLVLYHSLAPGKSRMRVTSILGIMLFADVPIIYYSVNWWRTLHQPATLIESKGSTLAPEMLSVLLLSLAFTVLFAVALWRVRYKNLRLHAEIEQLTYNKVM